MKGRDTGYFLAVLLALAVLLWGLPGHGFGTWIPDPVTLTEFLGSCPEKSVNGTAIRA